MNIILTGASGFLGENLTKHLQKLGHNILPLSFRPKNIEDFKKQLVILFRNQSIELVINTATSQLTDDNVQSIEQLCYANVLLPCLLAANIKEYSPETALVNFGTHWQNGEHGEYSPFNAYAATKKAAEDILEHYCLSGQKIASLILYDTYGPNDSRNKVLNLLIEAAVSEKKLDMSGGQQTIDLVHIDDVCKAVELVIQNLLNPAESDNPIKSSIRSNHVITVEELANLVAHLCGKETKEIINLGALDYRNRERFSDVSTYDCLPQWQAKISLADGIKDILTARINDNPD